MGFFTEVFVFILLILLAFILGQAIYFGLFGLLKDNKPLAKKIGKILNYAIFAVFIYIGIVYVLQQEIDSFIAAFGILGIAAAFASQQTVANLFASFVIGFQKSLGESDIIEIEGKVGQVKDVNLLSVSMKTFDGKIVLIPKSFFMSNSFINYSTGKVLRLSLPLQISTKTSIEEIKKILMDLCLKDKNILPEVPFERTLFDKFFKTPAEKRIYSPDVIVKGISANFFSIELLVWVYDIKNKDKIVSDLYLTIFEEFKKRNIELKATA